MSFEFIKYYIFSYVDISHLKNSVVLDLMDHLGIDSLDFPCIRIFKVDSRSYFRKWKFDLEISYQNLFSYLNELI